MRDQELNSVARVSEKDILSISKLKLVSPICVLSLSCFRKNQSDDAGSEEKLSADTVALEKLEFVASLSAPIGSSSGGADDLQTILKKTHSARDKHIFRCKLIFLL